MADYAIREFRGPEDALPQYELWLRATAALPRAWRSCLRNVESQLHQGVKHPGCRLYAEAKEGGLLGYIGTHPPFEWLASEHGPPSQPLGWAIPFGFPWTDPPDADLEARLYDEMTRLTPRIYCDFPRDIYIQRFRESWTRHVSFLEQRRWRLHTRVPLIGREIGQVGPPSEELVVATDADLPLVARLCRNDEHTVKPLSAEGLRDRYQGGWIVHETFWRLGERGVFALEQRGRWAAVTVMFAGPDAWAETLGAAAAQAAALGAEEIYFTVEAHESQLLNSLQQQGFREVDAGVYYVRDAD